MAEQAQENRRLARRNMQVQEDERRTLAHEIHDELGQSLNAIKLDAVAIRQRRWQTPEELDEYTASIIDLTNNLHGSVRALARRLRPVALDELGLGDAIELYLSHWERRNTPIKTCFSTHGDLSSHGEQINITLYRCIQECLTNITRHAGATQVKVNLRQIDRRIELRIEDDGCGMDPLARHVGLGLIGLRERAQALGGSFTLRSRPGTGTCAEMIIPD